MRAFFAILIFTYALGISTPVLAEDGATTLAPPANSSFLPQSESTVSPPLPIDRSRSAPDVTPLPGPNDVYDSTGLDLVQEHEAKITEGVRKEIEAVLKEFLIELTGAKPEDFDVRFFPYEANYDASIRTQAHLESEQRTLRNRHKKDANADVEIGPSVVQFGRGFHSHLLFRASKTDDALAGVVLHEYYHDESEDSLKKRIEQKKRHTPFEVSQWRSVVSRAFSQGLEYNSDIRALSHLLTLGYDPQPMIDFFEYMHALDKKNKTKLEKSPLGHALRTHPDSKDRASAIRAALRQFMKDKTIFAYDPDNRKPTTKVVEQLEPLFKKYDDILARFHQTELYETLYFKDVDRILRPEWVEGSVSTDPGHWVKVLSKTLQRQREAQKNGEELEPHWRFVQSPRKPAREDMLSRFQRKLEIADRTYPSQWVDYSLRGLAREVEETSSVAHYDHRTRTQTRIPAPLGTRHQQRSQVLEKIERGLDQIKVAEQELGDQQTWLRKLKQGLSSMETTTAERLYHDVENSFFSSDADSDELKHSVDYLLVAGWRFEHRRHNQGANHLHRLLKAARNAPKARRDIFFDVLFNSSVEVGKENVLPFDYRYKFLEHLIRVYPAESLAHANKIYDWIRPSDRWDPFSVEQRQKIGSWFADAIGRAGLPSEITARWYTHMRRDLHVDLRPHAHTIGTRLQKQFKTISNGVELSELFCFYHDFPELRPFLRNTLDRHLLDLFPLTINRDARVWKQYEEHKRGDERYESNFESRILDERGYREKVKFIGDGALFRVVERILSNESESHIKELRVTKKIQSEFVNALHNAQRKLIAEGDEALLEKLVFAFAHLAQKDYERPKLSERRAHWQELAKDEMLALEFEYSEDGRRILEHLGKDERTKPFERSLERWIVYSLASRTLSPELEKKLRDLRVDILVNLYSDAWHGSSYSWEPTPEFRRQLRLILGTNEELIQDVWEKGWRTDKFNADLFRQTFGVEPDPSRMPVRYISAGREPDADKVSRVRLTLHKLQTAKTLPELKDIFNADLEISVRSVRRYYANRLLDVYLDRAAEVLPHNQYGQVLDDLLFNTNLNLRAQEAVGERLHEITDRLNQPEHARRAIEVYIAKLGQQQTNTQGAVRNENIDQKYSRDAEYLTRATTVKVLELLLESDMPLSEKRQFYLDMREELTIGDKHLSWKKIAVPLLETTGYSPRLTRSLIREFYPNNRDVHARKVNEVANLFELDRNQIESLEEEVFPDREKAKSYSDLLLLQGKLKGQIDTDPGPEELIDFLRWLQKKTDTPPKSVEAIVRSQLPREWFTKTGTLEKDVNKTHYRAERTKHLEEIRTRFYSNPIEARAAFLVELVDPRQKNSLFSEKYPEGKDLVFSLLTDGIEAEHAPLAKVFLRAYVNALDKRYGEGYLFVAELLGATTGDSEERTAAEAGRDLLGSRGSLWHKFGQMLGADPNLIPDDDVRETFLQLNEREGEVIRKRVIDLFDKALNTERSKSRRMKQVLKEGSVNVTSVVQLVDGQDYVARLVKHDADHEAQYERDVLLEMVRELNEEAKSLSNDQAEKVLLIAGALEEYGHAITEKLKGEADLRNDRRIESRLQPAGCEGNCSYSRTYKRLNAEVRLVTEAESPIVYRVSEDEDGANPEKLILYRLVPDEKEHLRVEDPAAYKRFRRAAWLAEMEALFRYGRFDPDGHFGNWRVYRDPNNPNRLLLRRIDFSQAEVLEPNERKSLKGALKFLFARSQPRHLTLRSQNSMRFISDFLSLVEPINEVVSTAHLERVVSEETEKLLSENKSANPVRLLSLLKSRVNSRLTSGHKIRFRLPIQMAVKSLFLTQQLIDSKDPEEAKFAANNFLRLALDQNIAQRAWVGVNSWIANKWQKRQEQKSLERSLAEEHVARTRFAERVLNRETKELTNETAEKWIEIFDSQPDLRPLVLKRIKEHLLADTAGGDSQPDRLVGFIVENDPDAKTFLRQALGADSPQLHSDVVSEIEYRVPELLPELVDFFRRGFGEADFPHLRKSTQDYVIGELAKNLGDMSYGALWDLGLEGNEKIADKIKTAIDRVQNPDDLSGLDRMTLKDRLDVHSPAFALLSERILHLSAEQLALPDNEFKALFASDGKGTFNVVLHLMAKESPDPKVQRRAFQQLLDLQLRANELGHEKTLFYTSEVEVGNYPADVVTHFMDHPLVKNHIMEGLLTRWKRHPKERKQIIALLKKHRNLSPESADRFVTVFGSENDFKLPIGESGTLERRNGTVTLSVGDQKLTISPENPALYEWAAQKRLFHQTNRAVNKLDQAELFASTQSLRGLLKLDNGTDLDRFITEPLSRQDWILLKNLVDETDSKRKLSWGDRMAEALLKRGLYLPEDSYFAFSVLRRADFSRAGVYGSWEPETRIEGSHTPAVKPFQNPKAKLTTDEAIHIVSQEFFGEGHPRLLEILERGFENPEDERMVLTLLGEDLDSESPETRSVKRASHAERKVVRKRIQDCLGSLSAIASP